MISGTTSRRTPPPAGARSLALEVTRLTSWMVSGLASWFCRQEDERHQVVVPDPQELEDGERASAGIRQRQHEPPEDREVVGAVDRRRLEQVAAAATRCSCAAGRSPAAGRTPCGPATPRWACCRSGPGTSGCARRRASSAAVKSCSSGTRAICSGTASSATVPMNSHVAALELHPGERVGGRTRRCAIGMTRGRDGDGERVDERTARSTRTRRRLVERRRSVVVEREARVGEDRPPTARALRRSVGRNELTSSPKRRDGPEDRRVPQQDHGRGSRRGSGESCADGLACRRWWRALAMPEGWLIDAHRSPLRRLRRML